MPLKIKFVGALRHLSGRTEFFIDYSQGMSLMHLVESLTAEYPGLRQTLTDGTLNDAKSNSLVIINGREISVLGGYHTQLNDGDEVVFVPVVHGG